MLNPQPWIGHASDRCKSRWGRRRPFIFILGLAAAVGLQMVAWAHEIVVALGAGVILNAVRIKMSASLSLSLSLSLSWYHSAALCVDIYLST